MVGAGWEGSLPLAQGDRRKGHSSSGIAGLLCMHITCPNAESAPPGLNAFLTSSCVVSTLRSMEHMSGSKDLEQRFSVIAVLESHGGDQTFGGSKVTGLEWDSDADIF